MDAARALVEKLITENAELVEKVICGLFKVAVLWYLLENILYG